MHSAKRMAEGEPRKEFFILCCHREERSDVAISKDGIATPCGLAMTSATIHMSFPNCA